MAVESKQESALILGASSGMGLAVAERLASEGYDLLLVFRARKKEARALALKAEDWRAQGLKVQCLNKDATQVEQIKDIVATRSSPIKLLLHSIARGNLKSLSGAQQQEAIAAGDWQLTLEAMSYSYALWAQEITQVGAWANNALCCALTSEGARKAWPQYGAVGAAKAALEAINRSLALELAPLGHRANLLQPGVTDTPALRLIPGAEQLMAHARKRNPYRRLTQPEDVARALSLLLKPEAEWINGALIPVDGGESIR